MDEIRHFSTRRPLVSRLIHLLLWFVALSLGILAVLRIVYLDGNLLLIWLNAFSRYLYVPAYLCAAWAAWQRRWWLLGVSSMVVAFHVVLLAPDFVSDRRFDPTGALAFCQRE
jgi:hypothetical protein